MNIREFLREARLTQLGFARRIGVSQGRLQQWFAGEAVPIDRCLLIERESGGACRVEEIRPDLPWRRDESDRPLLDGFEWVSSLGTAANDPAPAESGVGRG